MTSSPFERPHTPLVLFLLLSLLLHALLFYLTPPPAPQQSRQKKPIIVEVQPLRQTRETVNPSVPPPPEKVVSHREGPQDQQVQQEQAPTGHDLEDSAKHQPRPPQTIQQPARPKSATAKQPPIQLHAPAPQAIAVESPSKKKEPLPTLEQLLQSANHAAADIARDTRIKKRDDVAKGEVVWLNMQEDRLFSFFTYFTKSIYGVWNYPQQAIEQKQQGVALLKIVINRDGSVEDVDLVDGSPFELLNREAIAAVFKGGPYIPLPASYPDDQLTIMANFEYQLGMPGRAGTIYGQPKRGAEAPLW
ncbi:MAG: TonB family protein [Desulfuromonadaceae bacterium]|nr:TonB family protein [Desulfuromonadaceae bacterium]